MTGPGITGADISVHFISIRYRDNLVPHKAISGQISGSMLFGSAPGLPLKGFIVADSRKSALSLLPQYDGIVALNKPSGPASAQCLLPFKRQGQKKIGHAGTLDPLASGVLIVLLGQATKLSGWLLAGGHKTYSGTIRLGIETDTWDMEGRIIAEKPFSGITSEMIAPAIAEWTTITEQAVPSFSAAKHHGQPLYKLARKGHDIPAKRKCVSITEADMLEISMPFVKFRVSCSSGSYIRSLAHSLGVRLGCGAALSGLTREYSYPYSLEDCVSLDKIEEGLRPEQIRPLNSALPDWPCIELNSTDAGRVRNGMAIRAVQPQTAPMAFLCYLKKPVAIGRLFVDADEAWWQVARGLVN